MSHPSESAVEKIASDRIQLSSSATDSEIVLRSPHLAVDDVSKIQAFILMDVDAKNVPCMFVDHIMADGSTVESVDFKNGVCLRTGEYRIQRTTKAFSKAVKAVVLRLVWEGVGTVKIKQFAVKPKP